MATWPNWTRDVLQAGGWPVSGQNVSFLGAWQAYEGGGATFNPLNTTQGSGTNYNSVGVKNFPTAQAGAAATVATLRNGRYPHVVAALASGRPYDSPDIGAVASEIRVWGTGNFAAQLDTGAPGHPGGQHAFGSSIPQGGTDTSVWAWGGNLGSKVADAIKGPLDVLKAALWLLDPKNWLRAVEMIVGMVLIILGLVFMARTLMESGSILDALKPAKSDADKKVGGGRKGSGDGEEEAFFSGERAGYLAEVKREGRRQGRQRRLREAPSAQNAQDIPF